MNAGSSILLRRVNASGVDHSGGPVTRSAMDVIRHRLEMNFTRPPDTNDSTGTPVAGKMRRTRSASRPARARFKPELC